jgi:hypothetical protein
MEGAGDRLSPHAARVIRLSESCASEVNGINGWYSNIYKNMYEGVVAMLISLSNQA